MRADPACRATDPGGDRRRARRRDRGEHPTSSRSRRRVATPPRNPFASRRARSCAPVLRRAGDMAGPGRVRRGHRGGRGLGATTIVRAMTAKGPQAPDRSLAMELVRVTEAAALAAGRWLGRGDKEGADGAAVDAMRIVLTTVPMDGVVVIGEGEKDEAPMLYNGEAIGDGSPPMTDIAVDPIDGTTLTAKGRGNALSVIAVSERGSMFDPGPCVYMEKIAVGPEARG